MKITPIIALSCLALSGCGLSYDYQSNSLAGAGPSSLCYAATDPRTGGFAVRRQAAQDIIDQKGISCDYGTQASLHAGQAEAQQRGTANALGIISAGVQMTQPPPVTNCIGNADSFACTRIR